MGANTHGSLGVLALGQLTPFRGFLANPEPQTIQAPTFSSSGQRKPHLPPLRLKVAAREAPGSLRPPPHVSRGPLGPHPPSRPAPEAPGGDSASGSGMGGLSLQAEASTLFTKGTYGAKNNDRLALFSPGHSGRVGPATAQTALSPHSTPAAGLGKGRAPGDHAPGKGPGGAWSLAAWSL